MKKNCLLLILLGTFLVQAQTNTIKPFDFEPKMRIGTQYPIQLGATALQKFYKSSLGIDANFTLFKVYNLEFTGGFSIAGYTYEPQDDFIPYTRSQQTIYYGQLGYSFPIYKKIDITPCFTLGLERLSHRDGPDRLALQNGVVTRIGAYADYRLNSVFSAYIGMHLSYTNYAMAEGISKYRDWYSNSQTVFFNLGLEFN